MDADGNRVEFEINDEIRGVMDRMLASEEEIEKSRAVREAERLAHILTEQGIPDDVSERYRDVVTGWLGQLEEYEFKRNAHEAVQNVARTIRENGGLRFGDFIVQLGEDLARDVRKRWPGLFRNTTDGPQLELDVLTQTLQENRTKTGWVIREKALNRKKLLFARSEPLATDPGVGVVSRTGPYGNREGTVPNARQKSNFAATVSPGKAGVNTMLTLSEAEGERFPALRIVAGVASVPSFIAFFQCQSKTGSPE